MEKTVTDNPMSPHYVPEEYQTPYDVVDLPSQGLLYKNNKKTVKLEFLTAMDETILSSPNLINSSKFVDVLLSRKVKELGFDTLDMLEGDRAALLLYLRIGGFGSDYTQNVYDPDEGKILPSQVNLTEVKLKKLEVKPDANNEFDFVMPMSKQKIKFRLLTGRDEQVIDEQDSVLRTKDEDEDISHKLLLRLERQIMSIDGEKDKIKISNLIKRLPIRDSRALRSYVTEVEPGIDLNVIARTPGGGSVTTFLRFNTSFFWPEL